MSTTPHEALHAEVVARMNGLRASLEPLGDLVQQALTAIAEPEFQPLFLALKAQSRAGILSDLGLQALKKPNQASLTLAFRRLPTTPPLMRDKIARFLTRPVIDLMCEAAGTEPDVRVSDVGAIREAAYAAAERWGFGAVRLALVSHWDNARVPAAMPLLLGIAMSDQQLALPPWNEQGKAILEASEEAEYALAQLFAATDHQVVDEESCCESEIGMTEDGTPDGISPIRSPRDQEVTAADSREGHMPEAVESKALLRDAELTLGAAREAAQALHADIEAGSRPSPQSLDVIAAFGQALDTAARALGEPCESLGQLADIVQRREEADREATTLAEIDRLAGPAILWLRLDALKGLLRHAYESEHSKTRSELFEGASALVELIRLEEDNVERLLELDERVRRCLPDAYATLITARGSLGFSASPEAPPLEPAESQTAAPAKSDIDGTEGDSSYSDPVVSRPNTNETRRPVAADPIALERASEPPALEEPPRQEQPEGSSTTDTPSADDPTVETSDSRFAEVLSHLLAERRYGLASRLSSASGGTAARARAFRMAALADAIRNPNGPCAAAVAAESEGLSRSHLEGDSPAQLVALVAGVRSLLRSPYSDTGNVVLEMVPAFAERAPVLCELAERVRAGSLTGVPSQDLAGIRDVAQLESSVREYAQEAEDFLRRQRGMNFQRAAKMWQEWVGQHGLLSELLGPVAANKTRLVDEVAANLIRIRSRGEVEKSIDTMDRKMRGPSSRRIEGPARLNLIERGEEALSLADSWVTSVRTLRSRQENAWEQQALRDLRQHARDARALIHSELGRLADPSDPVLEGTARGAWASLSETLALLEGQPLTGSELRPDLVLDGELQKLAIPEAQKVEGPSGLSLEHLLQAADLSWGEAFSAQAGRDDHAATGVIVETLSAIDGDLAAKLSAERSEAVSRLEPEIGATARRVEDELSRARRQGLLFETPWRDLRARLSAAADEQRKDFGRRRAELDLILRDLEGHEVHRREALITDIESRPGLPDELVAVLRDRVNAGDCATAQEYLVLHETGEDIPHRTGELDALTAFFPAVPDGLPAGITDELIAAVREGREHGPLSFANLPEPVRQTGARALEQFRAAAVASATPEALGQLLQLPLRMVGFNSGKVKRPDDKRTHTFVQFLEVSRNERSLVPAFGSRAGTTLRVLETRGAPSVRQVIQWTEESAEPVVVLAHGTIPVAARRELLQELRERRGHKPIVLIDDAVLAFVIAQGPRDPLATTMSLTLPFTPVNPYQPNTAGDLPEEMFFGRTEERAQMLDPDGTSLIYGGRQLGKSALLRAAKRRFERTAQQLAVYIDLSDAAIGATRQPEAIWTRILDQLIAREVVSKGRLRTFTGTPADQVERAIKTWLDEDPTRRLLLLLDECDDFFDEDATRAFANSTRLRSLWQGTGRRFKAVMAGLHKVQRFADIPNQPFAHFGRPLVIGPLSPQSAFDLITQPLAALGIAVDAHLVGRILTYANYSPLNLQLFGEALVERMRAIPVVDGVPPLVVTEDVVEEVASDRRLQAEISSRFDLTLRLDNRYRVLAYAMAFRAHDGKDQPTSVVALRSECAEWWPEVFTRMGHDEFTALADEMVGLGVLLRAEGGYRMRSPNVLRMLGSEDEVCEALQAVQGSALPQRFSGGEARRVLSGDGTRSPLAEAQLAQLMTKKRHQYWLLVGSAATGAENVLPALRSAVSGFGLAVRLHVPKRIKEFESAIRDSGQPGEHAVVFSDLSGVAPETCTQSLEYASGAHEGREGTCAVVLLAGPPNFEWLASLLDGDEAQPDVAGLRRYDTDSLRAWAIEVQRAFQDDASRERLLAITGGWPLLVDRVSCSLLNVRVSAEDVMRDMEDGLQTTAGAEELVTAVGVADDLSLARVYDQIIQYSDFDQPLAPEEVAFAASEAGHEHPLGAIRLLALLGALTESGGGEIQAEPVLAQAWQRVGIAAVEARLLDATAEDGDP